MCPRLPAAYRTRIHSELSGEPSLGKPGRASDHPQPFAETRRWFVGHVTEKSDHDRHVSRPRRCPVPFPVPVGRQVDADLGGDPPLHQAHVHSFLPEMVADRLQLGRIAFRRGFWGFQPPMAKGP